MLVELDVELLVQRPSVEAGDLAIDIVHQRRRHVVVDDRVEADLGQRIAQLGRSMVERPGLVRELGSEIDNRDRASIGHGFGRHAVTSPTAAIVLSPACLFHHILESEFGGSQFLLRARVGDTDKLQHLRLLPVAARPCLRSHASATALRR